MALHSYNTTFYYFNSSFITVGAVENISVSMTSSTVDATNLGSTSRQFLKGIADSGEVNLTVHLDPSDTDHIYLRDAIYNDPGSNSIQFKILFAGGKYSTFYGFVTKFDTAIDLDEKVTAEISIKVTGEITFA